MVIVKKIDNNKWDIVDEKTGKSTSHPEYPRTYSSEEEATRIANTINQAIREVIEMEQKKRKRKTRKNEKSDNQ